MTKSIPKICLEMPTEEESQAYSEKWMQPLRPCLYSYWPQQYKDISFPTHIEEITAEEREGLSKIFDDKSDSDWCESLKEKIKRGVSKYESGCFFKLESRSPKDSFWGEATNFRSCSHYDIKKIIYSERMLDDLVSYSHLKSEPLRLLFREWKPIEKSDEFRCFIKDRNVIGISQYFYTEKYEKTLYSLDNIEKAANDFLKDKILPYLPVDNLVVDILLPRFGQPLLIEINPYRLSDPCLFTYDDLESGKYEFRVVKQPEEA